ncbi:MAG TPA: PaaI family thioesterase [Methylibium sp.]|uniref:PaaI family thioesterase n=1 Tax=Methylibium sp. TaxID=2067992 RepID=UPI002DBF58CD|nr:PaaI family thioesterase [Methylibium sp.]HEU4460659.1 PaaI family thioesterase [Methylibium sp.]
MDFPVRIPFVEQLGFRLNSMSDGTAELSVQLTNEQTNSFGVAHGGLTMTLLDVAMAHAARSVNTRSADFSPGVVTIEMKTSFLRPAQGTLIARGRLLHRTATMAFCEGSVLGADGALCAHATGTFKYLRALPAASRELRPLNGPPRIEGRGSA